MAPEQTINHPALSSASVPILEGGGRGAQEGVKAHICPCGSPWLPPKAPDPVLWRERRLSGHLRPKESCRPEQSQQWPHWHTLSSTGHPYSLRRRCTHFTGGEIEQRVGYLKPPSRAATCSALHSGPWNSGGLGFPTAVPRVYWVRGKMTDELRSLCLFPVIPHLELSL